MRPTRLGAIEEEPTMAWYKYESYLQKSSGDAYDYTYDPSATTPHSGIYRCMGCGREIAANKGNPLPPQNHHQHSSGQGAIKWRLIVYADGNAK
jgi:hypothetical protein